MKELELTNNIDDKTYGGTFSNMVYNEFKKTRDQNLFEEVIDDLMMTKYSDDQETIDYIKSSNLKDKRLKILSLIDDSETPRFLKLKEKIEGNKVSKVTHLIETLEDLRIFIKYGSVQNKTLGEIMTPIEELAKPMVKLVEKYDSDFWKDPTNKVLDSSAGLGTFLILSLIKFMKGLENWEPDVEKRYKHIVENCLYYGELQSRNVFFWLCLIDPYDEYTTNTYWGSFLEEGFDNHMKNVWEVESFSLIIQNPPYQYRKEGFKKTQPLWHLFVQKSLGLVSKDKYMVMVHPGGWRNVDGMFKETQKKLRENQILELSIFNEKKGLEFFGAETRFDYYILKKNQKPYKTLINSQDGHQFNINIKDFEFIPNNNFKLYELLLPKNGELVTTIISDSSYHTQRPHLSKDKDDNFKYICIYTVKSEDISTEWYSNVNDKGHFRVPKLIWSNFRISSAGSLLDINGEYGLTQFSYAIVDNEDKLPHIKKAFDSKKFRNFMEDCSVSDMSINRKVIATFRKDFWKEFI